MTQQDKPDKLNQGQKFDHYGKMWVALDEVWLRNI